MIVGWRVASNMRTTMVLDAIEMARWSRGITLPGLRCHSDAGSQFTSIRYGERLAEIGAAPSIGSVGDSFDNALAETVNGYYKAELIYGPARPGPLESRRRCRLATSWVHWHNTARLHGYLGDLPPAEFETIFYAAKRTDPAHLVEIQFPLREPGRFTNLDHKSWVATGRPPRLRGTSEFLGRKVGYGSGTSLGPLVLRVPGTTCVHARSGVPNNV